LIFFFCLTPCLVMLFSERSCHCHCHHPCLVSSRPALCNMILSLPLLPHLAWLVAEGSTLGCLSHTVACKAKLKKNELSWWFWSLRS
jgi:hypothetical protein